MVSGIKECDDGNAAPNDGCASDCTVETGFTCTGEPSQCHEVCGDGLRVGTEGCDDGNSESGDGCPKDCSSFEVGYDCDSRRDNPQASSLQGHPHDTKCEEIQLTAVMKGTA